MARLVPIALLLALFTLVGCGDSHDKVAGDMVKVMEDYADILADVDDEASAKAAGPKLEKLAGRITAINERTEALGEPESEQEKSVQDKYQKKFEEAGLQIERNITRISGLDPAVSQELDRSLLKMQEALMDAAD